MTVVQIASNKGTRAVKKLREQKLKNGLPFMINVKELSTDQCYLEYPNGSIKLISVAHSSRDFAVIRELSNIEATRLRSRFNFSMI
ncbi:MAG: hypothetical protein ACOYVG_09730 [Bacteroidota bacterium]